MIASNPAPEQAFSGSTTRLAGQQGVEFYVQPPAEPSQSQQARYISNELDARFRGHDAGSLNLT